MYVDHACIHCSLMMHIIIQFYVFSGCCAIIIHDVLAWSQMEEVCFSSLDKGKAKDWKRERKEKIVKNFIQESQELQDLKKSKEGIWSGFKGFFQWSYSAILG